MTPSLRKAHRRIWLSLAILLPAVFIAAVASIPETQPDPSQRNEIVILPIVRYSSDSDLFSVKIRTDEADTEYQMEVLNKKALIAPECLIYIKCKETDKVLAGKLGSKGIYHFDLGNNAIVKQCQVEFYNPFDNTIVEMISFK